MAFQRESGIPALTDDIEVHAKATNACNSNCGHVFLRISDFKPIAKYKNIRFNNYNSTNIFAYSISLAKFFSKKGELTDALPVLHSITGLVKLCRQIKSSHILE